MSIPPFVVIAARWGWQWQWQRLMGGLAPADSKGNYQRPASDHQLAELPEDKNLLERKSAMKHHLIIGRSCPWAHRTWIVNQLRDLGKSITLLMANADHRGGRWIINPPWLGCKSLLDLYKHCGVPPTYRATVPVLIDPKIPRIMGNESSQLIEILNRWPAPKKAVDLSPVTLLETIHNWHKILQPAVNDGVYRCGFARNQSSYDKAQKNLYEALNMVEDHLADKGPWLCGDHLTLADVRLFPTLIRWEMVYSPLFGCSTKPLWEFPKIWDWRIRFYNLPGIAISCNEEAWRQDYFGALFPLNPSGIIPTGPKLSTLLHKPVTQS